jgi:hypothetical protein
MPIGGGSIAAASLDALTTFLDQSIFMPPFGSGF